MRRIWILAAIALICIGSPDFAVAKSKGAHHGHTVHVHGYYRKNGTYVHSYTRSSPSHHAHLRSSHHIRSARTHTFVFHRTAQPLAILPSNIKRDSNGRIERSTAAKDEFKRLHPCPSTGQPSGACPGYVIDHIKPLRMGGADAPSNMQWQTIKAAKEKDKIECGGEPCSALRP